MAAVHGKATRIYLNEFDVSGFLNSASIAGTGETADISAFGDTWKEHIPGQLSASFTTTGHHDADLTELDSILGTGGQVLTHCPGGASAIGDLARLISTISTTLTTSASLGGAVAIGWDGTADTAVGIGWVLHPLAEDTNTTTGATRDDSAATSTGWQAHLHVTALDGGSWVVKLQDSANGSTWADVTDGAFTAATTATSQRLVSASATTELRRYVRYVATRTGGVGGDGITFHLSYARNV